MIKVGKRGKLAGSAVVLFLTLLVYSFWNYPSTKFYTDILIPENATDVDQHHLTKLLKLCHEGDSLMFTRDVYIHGLNSTRDIYLNTCFPLEISTSQGARSMGHCSDFVLFVYYSGARLSPDYDGETYALKRQRCPKSTYLHGEYPIEELINGTARNFWLPNAEQVKNEQAHLIPKVDMILAKTVKTYEVFNEYLHTNRLNVDMIYNAHSTPDPFYQLDQLYERNFSSFYHGNGHSGLKATYEIKQCWKQHPEWPTLTIVGNQFEADLPNLKFHRRLDLKELRKLQYVNGVHLCPSTREGFGHYLNEARAMSAMVMTTDFGPMNEFVTPHSGLIIKTGAVVHETYQLFPNVQIGLMAEHICQGVTELLKIPESIREFMGKNGRLLYKQRYMEMVRDKKWVLKNTMEYYHGRKLTDGEIKRSLEQLNYNLRRFAY